jgi:hypothetical protein
MAPDRTVLDARSGLATVSGTFVGSWMRGGTVGFFPRAIVRPC